MKMVAFSASIRGSSERAQNLLRCFSKNPYGRWCLRTTWHFTQFLRKFASALRLGKLETQTFITKNLSQVNRRDFKSRGDFLWYSLLLWLCYRKNGIRLPTFLRRLS